MSDFDWASARRYYISDERHSYEDVSSKFGMSEVAIRAYQDRNGESWPQMRKDTIRKVSEKLPEKLGENIAEMNARHIKLGRMMEAKGARSMTDREEVDSNGNVILKEGIGPKNQRDATALIVAGVTLQRRAAGADRPDVIAKTSLDNIVIVPPTWFRDYGEENQPKDSGEQPLLPQQPA